MNHWSTEAEALYDALFLWRMRLMNRWVRLRTPHDVASLQRQHTYEVELYKNAAARKAFAT